MFEILAKSSDPVGIFGVVLVLIAYYLLSINKISSQNFKYQILNLIGSLGILFSLMFNWNTSAVLVEFSWAIISLIGIIRIMRNKATNV